MQVPLRRNRRAEIASSLSKQGCRAHFDITNDHCRLKYSLNLQNSLVPKFFNFNTSCSTSWFCLLCFVGRPAEGRRRQPDSNLTAVEQFRRVKVMEYGVRLRLVLVSDNNIGVGPNHPEFPEPPKFQCPNSKVILCVNVWRGKKEFKM